MSLLNTLFVSSCVLVACLTIGGVHTAANATNEAVGPSLPQWSDACFELPCFDGARPLAGGALLVNDAFRLQNTADLHPSPDTTPLALEQVDSMLDRVAAATRARLLQPERWQYDLGQATAAAPATVPSSLAEPQPEQVKTLLEQGLPFTSNAQTSADAAPLPKVAFVQKLMLPQHATVAVFGDLHGSVHSLLRELAQLQQQGFLEHTNNTETTMTTTTTGWRIAAAHKNDFFMLFLGDYVDRGAHGGLSCKSLHNTV